eukprot:CAMPEP_0170548402 /NCGR_PEP_ID=MMETSP0211-20121228/6727_1 /TAXON_ID=311385 /ORGANISM="Pseudokeronopsis sp., Strain OXSARD2" /LENGTH=151 /DNA_ID=CAMNT_0010853943 /DNA_START=882 /DNA_END=1334 /DNA_ORIENTATION=-
MAPGWTSSSLDLVRKPKVTLRLGCGEGVGVSDKDEVFGVHGRAELLQLLALFCHEDVFILTSLVQTALSLPGGRDEAFRVVEGMRGGGEEVRFGPRVDPLLQLKGLLAPNEVPRDLLTHNLLVRQAKLEEGLEGLDLLTLLAPKQVQLEGL